MIFLSLAIIVALVVTIALPIVAGIWLNKKWYVPWRVITYGAMAYFVVQALMTFLFSGFVALVDNGTLALSDQAYLIVQLIISVVFSALLGVVIRWAGMRFIKEPLVSLEAAYAIGLGYGGVESLIGVGLPLLMTFISMLSNINIDPQTTTLAPEVVSQLEALWQIQPFVPLAGSLERIAALVMHISVTVLVLQAFTRKNTTWLAAAFGLELLVNGMILGLAEAGLAYGWVILIAVILMAANLYLLYRLDAFDVKVPKMVADPVQDDLQSY
jgi:uncharacterized membrane protein YhfC